MGAVPAPKPAAQLTRTKEVAVLGTELTARGAALQQLIDKLCKEVTVNKIAFREFAEAVERGDTEKARRTVSATWQEYRCLPIDVVVLGCTCYTPVRNDIQIIGARTFR